MKVNGSLRTRLGLVFVLFAAMLVVNAGAVLILSDIANQRTTQAILVNSLRARSQRIAKDALMYSLRGDVNGARAGLTEGADLFDRTLSAMLDGGNGWIAAEEEPVRVERGSAVLDGQLREVEQLWQPIRDAVGATLAAPPGSSEAQAAAEPIVTGNEAVLGRLGTTVITALDEFHAARDLRTAVSVTLAALALVLVGIGWWWVGRVVVGPIVQMAATARGIAAGNLATAVPSTDRADEIGVLARAFQEMSISLRSNLESLREATNNLAASSGEILAASTELTAGVTQEAAAAAEIGASADEVRATAEEASARAEEVAGSAARVSEVALSGQAAIESSQQAMVELQSRVRVIAEQILALSEQTQSIGHITSTVEDLADQSNLLAVNAAIEAAKAGEEGRGFAIVAREVRNLADQSREATDQIRSVLVSVQKAAQSAVLVTEEGTKSVEATSRRLEQAGEVIDQLATAVGQSAELARQIAAGSSQQRVGVEQVGAGIAGIVGVSNQTAAAARQLQGEAQGLAKLAEHLKDLAAGFDLDERSDGRTSGRLR